MATIKQTVASKKWLIKIGELLGFSNVKEYGILISIGNIFFYFVWRDTRERDKLPPTSIK